MEKNYKINIPDPCSEDWNKMTPNENGRFCMSCSKTVVDFTSMHPEEIQHFFIQNQNEKICGRFRKSQLDTIIIQIPDRILFSQTHYHKMFLLALFISMGTTLFSCQDKEGNKKRIDKIEVVKNNVRVENYTKGKSLISDSKIPPPPKIEKIKFLKPSKISCGYTTAKDSIIEDDTIIMGAAIETKADYPNGIDSFYKFFIEEFKLPETTVKIKNPILVSFIIERDGTLTSFEFPKETDSETSKEISRVLKLSPKWIPGTQNGKNIRIKYSLPISIQSWEENTK